LARHVEEDPEDDSMPGQDSFIDVICNMVGILITLVVVVGMRVSQMVIDAPPPTETTPAVAQPAANVAKLQAELNQMLQARHEAASEIIDGNRQLYDMAAQEALVAGRRDQLTLVRAEVEQSIAERRSKLDAESQQDFDVQRQIAEAQLRLSSLTQEQLSLLSAPEEVQEIECVPTPLAKTVSGDEIHVRLRRGQLAVVPVDELLAEVERRGGSYIRGGLAQRNEASDTYGPIDGFRMRLSVERRVEPVPAGALPGTPQRAMVVLQGVFLPTNDNIGMALDQALLPAAPFSQALRARKSAVGAVTAWVYPDSYAELRILKKAMWEAGVPLAVRPLPTDQPITFSTLGSKSAAQ
jgi:hypothetical protein